MAVNTMPSKLILKLQKFNLFLKICQCNLVRDKMFLDYIFQSHKYISSQSQHFPFKYEQS